MTIEHCFTHPDRCDSRACRELSAEDTDQRDAGAAGDWRHRAACQGADPELFFPAADCGQLFEAQVARAKAVCAGCPVCAQCVVFALAALPYGIAGGLTPAERRHCRPGRVRRAPGAGGGPPAGASRPEVAAAGRDALRAGRPGREVAREFGVTERTAERWAAQVRAETSAVTRQAVAS